METASHQSPVTSHQSFHFGHRLPSFWTPVLHGVFASTWRVALRRNRFPVPVMTEHNPPKQPFWTPVLHGVFASTWRVALRRNRFPIPVMTEHNPPFWTAVTLPAFAGDIP